MNACDSALQRASPKTQSMRSFALVAVGTHPAATLKKPRPAMNARSSANGIRPHATTALSRFFVCAFETLSGALLHAAVALLSHSPVSSPSTSPESLQLTTLVEQVVTWASVPTLPG